MFNFFLHSHRKGILTFSGTPIENIIFDPNGVDAKLCFRKYDNGDYKNSPIITKHPNIVFSVIKGKKSWGLWKNEWIDGIVDWCFTVDEIRSQFTDVNIDIPEPLWKDFEKTLHKSKMRRYI